MRVLSSTSHGGSTLGSDDGVMGSFRAAVPLLFVLVVGGAAVGAVAATTIDEPARRTPLEFTDPPSSPGTSTTPTERASDQASDQATPRTRRSPGPPVTIVTPRPGVDDDDRDDDDDDDDDGDDDGDGDDD